MRHSEGFQCRGNLHIASSVRSINNNQSTHSQNFILFLRVELYNAVPEKQVAFHRISGGIHAATPLI
jgi:hypothetical protein